MNNGKWHSFGLTGSKMQINIMDFENNPTIVHITVSEGKTIEMSIEEFDQLKSLIKAIPQQREKPIEEILHMRTAFTLTPKPFDLQVKINELVEKINELIRAENRRR